MYRSIIHKYTQQQNSQKFEPKLNVARLPQIARHFRGVELVHSMRFRYDISDVESFSALGQEV